MMPPEAITLSRAPAEPESAVGAAEPAALPVRALEAEAASTPQEAPWE